MNTSLKYIFEQTGIFGTLSRLNNEFIFYSMANKRDLLVPGGYYHIYNKANAEDLLFSEGVEYKIFLKKYFSMSAILFRTYCYCLMSNHFHFLVQVHHEDELKKRIGIFTDDKTRSNFIAQHLGNFFNWYATYYNRKHDRKGSLFIHSFHRKPILTDQYMSTVICYIHANPVRAGLCKKFDGWEYSSYRDYVGKASQIACRERSEMINRFEDLDNFIFAHQLFLKNPSDL